MELSRFISSPVGDSHRNMGEQGPALAINNPHGQWALPGELPVLAYGSMDQSAVAMNDFLTKICDFLAYAFGTMDWS